MSEDPDPGLARRNGPRSSIGSGRLPWIAAGLGIVGLGFGVWLVAGHEGSSGGGGQANPPLQTVARTRALSAVSACLLTDAGGITHAPNSLVWAGMRAAADDQLVRASFLPVPEDKTSESKGADEPDKQTRATSRPAPQEQKPEATHSAAPDHKSKEASASVTPTVLAESMTNSLIAQRCSVVVAVGAEEIKAVQSLAPQHPRIRFGVAGPAAAGSVVGFVPSEAAARSAVGKLLAAAKGAP